MSLKKSLTLDCEYDIDGGFWGLTGTVSFTLLLLLNEEDCLRICDCCCNWLSCLGLAYKGWKLSKEFCNIWDNVTKLNACIYNNFKLIL